MLTFAQLWVKRPSPLNGNIAFVAADCCKALDIKDASMALRAFDDDEKGTSIIGTRGGAQKMLVVTEPGLYRLIDARAIEGEKRRTGLPSNFSPKVAKTSACYHCRLPLHRHNGSNCS